jgi:2-polyprenyl-3-methyl-5-hydroxy-6-metoxy-1,4-benzoquinol methylase
MENIEKVGNVILNLKHYPGKDLYSDGEDELLLLDIVKQYKESEYNAVINEKKNWALMYHLSHIRENIIANMPIEKDAQVLEVGAGCGAVTGALVRKAEHVTCVDLSKRRSMINALRHQDCDNLEIMVGNFQDVETDLQMYDYITLIGVFEYGQAYIDSENYAEEFLNLIKKHLKPDGKIIIAIENKLGLKYWAGCTEDHFGTYFEGIENYPHTTGVRTYSKKELKALFQAVNMDSTFYYPYPDYKFTMQIFSDDYLPSMGDLDSNVLNFDRERLLLFDEQKVFDTLTREDLFSEFANSFLIILQNRGASE